MEQMTNKINPTTSKIPKGLTEIQITSTFLTIITKGHKLTTNTLKMDLNHSQALIKVTCAPVTPE